MKRRSGTSRRGQSLIEFTLVGIPMLLVAVSIVYISLAGWQYQNLAYATEMTARYASVHGADCSENGNSCTVTLGNVATFFTTQGVALLPGVVDVTFTDGSGSLPVIR